VNDEGYWARNSATILITVVSSVISAALTWLVARMVGQPKTIDVAMRENTSLLAESATTAGARLKVTWDDKELLHPRLIRLRVINSGRRIIRANDFDKNEALWITVHGAVIIAPDLLATAGDVVCQLRAHPHDHSQIGLLPESLKRREWADLQLVVDGENYKKVSVRARCDLTRDPLILTQELEKMNRVTQVSQVVALSTVVLLLVLGGLGAHFYPAGREYGLRHSLPGIALLVAIYGMFLTFLTAAGVILFQPGCTAKVCVEREP
jgi:hypothetical protein